MRALATASAVLAVLAVAVTGQAQDRPVVLVTPGSARTFKAAVQTFRDESVTPKPGRADEFRGWISTLQRQVSGERPAAPPL